MSTEDDQSNMREYVPLKERMFRRYPRLKEAYEARYPEGSITPEATQLNSVPDQTPEP